MNGILRRKMYIRFFIFISLFLIGLFSYRMTFGTMPHIDAWLMPYVENIPSTSMVYSFFGSVTHLGSGIFLIPFTLVISVPLYMMFRSMIPWGVVSCGTLLTYLLNAGVKLIFQRERPQIVPELAAEGFSFPSGHAMISFVFYSLCMYFLYKRFTKSWVRRWVLICGSSFIALIGISRYVLSVHYVSDILTGYSFGCIFMLVIIHFYEKYVTRSGN